jgi:hypothetical protein
MYYVIYDNEDGLVVAEGWESHWRLLARSAGENVEGSVEDGHFRVEEYATRPW